MPRNAIIDSTTRALLVLAPPEDPTADIPLPNPNTEQVVLGDATLPTLDTPGVSFTVDASLTIVATPVPAPVLSAADQQHAADMQTVQNAGLTDPVMAAVARLLAG